MKRLLSLAWLAAMAALPFPQAALAQRAEYERWSPPTPGPIGCRKRWCTG